MELIQIINTGMPLADEAGVVLANIDVEFMLIDANGQATDAWDVATGARVAPIKRTITLNASGEFPASGDPEGMYLWPNDRGNAVTFYLCKVKYGGIRDFRAALPTRASGTITWMDFFANGTPLTPQQLDALNLHINDHVVHLDASAGAAGDMPVINITQDGFNYLSPSTDNIADSLDRRYVSDAELVILGNTSGINSGDQDLTNIYRNANMKAAISAAIGKNPYEQAPWCRQKLWAAGATSYRGEFVRNSAGHLYYRNPSAGTKTNGSTEPTHRDTSVIYDGGGISGAPWHYFGKPLYQSALEFFSTITPVATTDTMDGVAAFYANNSTMSTLGLSQAITLNATINNVSRSGGIPYYFSVNATIPAMGAAGQTTVIINSIAAGQIIVPNHATWVAGASCYLTFLEQLTGTTGGVGTYRAYIDRATSGATTTVANSSYPNYDMLASNVGTVSVPIASPSYVSTKFATNARWLAIERQTNFDPAIFNDTSIFIDGRPVVYGNVGKNGAGLVMLLDISALKSGETCAVEIAYKQTSINSGVMKIYIAGDEFISPISTNGLTLSTEGDSITAGGNSMPYAPMFDSALSVSRLLGFGNHFQSAVGGTRLTSSGSKTSYSERLSLVIQHAPQIHVVCGFHNEIGNSTETDFKNALRNYINTFTTALPDSYLFITGTRLLRGDFVATFLSYETYTSDVILNEFSGNSRVQFVPVLAASEGTPAGGWYPNNTTVLSGKYYQPSSLGSDAHPLIQESLMFHARLAMRIRSCILNS